MNHICYSCGCPMIDEAYYQQHTAEFASKPKFTHDEHIIHNALHGRLTSSRILCKDCGSTFGHEADGAFVSLFTPITARLKDMLLPKQHGKNTSNTLQGVLYEGGDPNRERRVVIKDNVVTPKEPFHSFDAATNLVTIYASAARAKHYKNIVIKELQANNLNPDEVVFKFVEEVQDMGVLGVFFTEGTEKFNERLRLGFNKIALGFAMYAGVPRTQVPRVLQLDAHGKGQLVDSQNLIPFYPIGALDRLVENFRPRLEGNYPSHTLILFSQPREKGGQALFCYVDLFSTFQYYVLLNEDYHGEPIYKSYHQATTKSVPSHVDLLKVRHKLWNVVAEQFEVDTTKFTGGDMDAYRAFIQRGIDTYSFNPQLNLPLETKTMFERVMPLLVERLPGENGEPDSSVLEFLQANHPAQYVALLTELHFYLAYNDETRYQRFRSSFIKVEENGNQEVMSYPSECQRPPMEIRHFQEYGHLKFGQLNDLINEAQELASLQQDRQQLAGASKIASPPE
ncbi:HNH endonuclease [Hymenobacter saemangeumensis]|uniref:HNH endonuclease n=1 Tax=Hymenobacter saemangeumensis TaxID=1084522 RepID=UPI0031E9BD2A